MDKISVLLWIGFAVYVWVCIYMIRGLYGI